MRNKGTFVAAAYVTVENASRTTSRAVLVCGCEIAIPKGSKGYYHNRCARNAPSGVVAVDTTRVIANDGTSPLVTRVIAAPATSSLVIPDVVSNVRERITF